MSIDFSDSFDSYLNGTVDGRGYRAGGYVGVLAASGTENGQIVSGRFAGSNGLLFRTFSTSAHLCRARTTPSTKFSFAAAICILNAGRNYSILGAANSNSADGVGWAIASPGFGRLQLVRRTSSGAAGFEVVADSGDWKVQFNQWNHYCIRGEIHATAGWIEVHLNGFLLFEVRDIDTRTALGMTEVSHASLSLYYATAGDGNIYDDFIMMTDDELIPEVRIVTQRPNSDVSNSGFAPSAGTTLWEAVDEQTPNLTDYISATAAGEYCQLGLTPLPYTPDKIYCVTVRGLGQKSDAASRAVSLGVTTVGELDVIGGETGLATSATPIRWQMETSPDTDDEWTPAEVTGLKLRPTITV